MSNMPFGAEAALELIHKEEEFDRKRSIYIGMEYHDHRDQVVNCFWQGDTSRKNAIFIARMWAEAFDQDDVNAMELAEFYGLDHIHAYAMMEQRSKFEKQLEEKLYKGSF